MKTNTVNFDKGNKEKHVSNDKMLCNDNYRTKLKFLNAVYNYVHLEILMKLVFPRKKNQLHRKVSMEEIKSLSKIIFKKTIGQKVL